MIFNIGMRGAKLKSDDLLSPHQSCSKQNDIKWEGLKKTVAWTKMEHAKLPLQR